MATYEFGECMKWAAGIEIPLFLLDDVVAIRFA
jgi:hypothetical protein